WQDILRLSSLFLLLEEFPSQDRNDFPSCVPPREREYQTLPGAVPSGPVFLSEEPVRLRAEWRKRAPGSRSRRAAWERRRRPARPPPESCPDWREARSGSGSA